MLRRLEDRIRELCSEALSAEEPELHAVFSKLKSALHEHTGRLRKLAGARFAIPENGHQQDRRSQERL